MRENWKCLWFLGTTLVLGLAARVFFAACYRFSLNSDYGIVVLMVKHIAAGRDLPVFYYGQPYMGSLEPIFSALLCKLFGFSSFNVCLGTACMGILLLPVIYAWGRDAGGRVAGLAALAFSIIGPVAYLRFLAMSWGGYALLLLLSTLILWLGGRLAVREFRDDAVSTWWYALLGLLA
jgi:4-amino-4-deoxy-L-arabinose transferase-like glycosyltransferase